MKFYRVGDKNNLFNLNSWQNVIIVVDSGKNTLSYFLNGKKYDEAKLTKAFNITTNYDIVFGRHDTYNDGSNYWAYTFKGLLDDVRIYNRTLDESEIQELYNLGK